MTLSNTSCTAQGGSGGVLDHLTDTKPVAWRHRFQEWQPWEYSSKDPHDAEQIVEPLYAQPASSQARIRELESEVRQLRIDNARLRDENICAALSRKDAP